jgi:hypothetical protein
MKLNFGLVVFKDSIDERIFASSFSAACFGAAKPAKLMYLRVFDSSS